ncbi:MAG: DNA helicase UvrD, partial [Tenericutes bacterium]|nr:DNA helicase UvrD [Mycoplasmatota bacterium]
ISLNHKDMHIDFLTIHKAKGLGYDYCVLLDLEDGIYGFPSKIEDEPVMKLIKPKIDEPVDYPEERRLFYVALTRTKNKIYMLVPKSKASSFAIELKNYTNVEIIRDL